jgi:nicotinate-nucleotide adenylyltransferase
MDMLAGALDSSVALLAGAWNPPTRAHVELARAALGWARRAVFVLPRAFPHKPLDGAPFEQRVEWIRALAALDPRFAAAVSEGGLFLEMAREARALGAQRVFHVCGADAAARILGWDYGPLPPIEQQLEEYELLVAPRPLPFRPPEHLRPRVHTLIVPASLDGISSTEVRRRIAAGEPWRHLVPEPLAASIGAAYGA